MFKYITREREGVKGEKREKKNSVTLSKQMYKNKTTVQHI